MEAVFVNEVERERSGQGRAVTAREVSAWACGMCRSLHETFSEANGCCRCSGCGGKFKRRTHYTSQCDGCAWGQSVRGARADIRRAREQLASNEKRLADLLAKKPIKASKESR